MAHLKNVGKYKKSVWDLGNKVLYNLCKKYPKHKNKNEILAKIWLIGRSYAASIERRQKYKKESTDKFYDRVGKTLKKFNTIKKLDKRLSALKNKKLNGKGVLDKILSIHEDLTKVFKGLTGKNQRSLASKYLHFHCPVFPIFDSRAKTAINNEDKESEEKESKKDNQVQGDKEYSEFCRKFLKLYKRIKKKKGEFTVRQIDNYLLKSK